MNTIIILLGSFFLIREICEFFSDFTHYIPMRASWYLLIGLVAALAVVAFGTAVGITVSIGASLQCVGKFWRWRSDE